MKVICQICRSKDDKSVMTDSFNSKGNRTGYVHNQCEQDRIEHKELMEYIAHTHSLPFVPPRFKLCIQRYKRDNKLSFKDIELAYTVSRDKIESVRKKNKEKFIDSTTKQHSDYLELVYCWEIIKSYLNIHFGASKFD